MGDKLEKTIDEICAMGFGREEAKKALRAAFNNPDRAIEYLINVPKFKYKIICLIGNTKYS